MTLHGLHNLSRWGRARLVWSSPGRIEYDVITTYGGTERWVATREGGWVFVKAARSA